MMKTKYSAAHWLRPPMVTGVMLIVMAVGGAVAFAPPFGKWTRLVSAPILSPQRNGFESSGTFNPAVVKKDGQFVMLYRAQDHQGTS